MQTLGLLLFYLKPILYDPMIDESIPMTEFFLNNTRFSTQAPTGRALLDVIRDEARLTGTKRVCGEGDCGACTVLIGRWNGMQLSFSTSASCILPVAEVHHCLVITVEGLSAMVPNPIQQIMLDTGASQCGFCTPGIVLALTAFLLNSSTLSDEDARLWVEGNICRCTGYAGINRAAEAVAQTYRPLLAQESDRVSWLAVNGVLPAWTADMPRRLLSFVETTDTPAPLPGTLPLAGGTDLFVQQQSKLEETPLRFLSREAIRDDIWEDDASLYIGGLATVETLRQSQRFNADMPQLTEALRLVSSQLIRQQATVAGNLVNASPIGDLTLMMLALGAELGLHCGDASRTLPLNKFYQGYKEIDLKPDELILWIRIPLGHLRHRFHFEKVSRRQHLDIASVNTALRIALNEEVIHDLALSAGGVGPVPMLLKATMMRLVGKPCTPETLQTALERLGEETAPIDDVRGTAQYKSDLLRRLITAHFIECFPDAGFERGLA